MALSDESLIKQCLDGDDGAFGFIVDKYKGAVYSLAYRKLSNYHDAEEIAQETFLKAYQKLSTLKNVSNFAGWLYVICANCCRDRVRKRHRENRILVPLKRLSRGEIAYSSYTRYVSEQKEQSIIEAIDGLPESERTVVTLHYFGGLSCAEISRFLGVSLSAAKTRLYRARKRLREEMIRMLEQTWGRSQLGSGFTFQLMEIVRKMSPFSVPKPVPRRWIPIGALVTALILSFGSLFTSSTIPPFSLDAVQESIEVKLIELPQQSENPQINPPAATTSVQAGKGGSGSDNDSRVGETSALALSDKVDEQEPAQTFSIKGVVLRDARPQAGVPVYAMMDDSLLARMVSRSDGTYQFHDIPVPYDGQLRHYKLFACVDKQWMGWAELTEFDDLDNLPLRLFPARSITGTVKDQNSRPIEGASVRAAKIRWVFSSGWSGRIDSPDTFPFFPSASTDANGSFVVYNMPYDMQTNASADIVVEKDGYALFTAYQSLPGSDLDITLRPAAVIKGRLIDPASGEPAKGVLLECKGSKRSSLGRDTSFHIQTRTAEDGSYRFDRLPQDEYSIGLAERPPGRTAAPVKNVSVQSGQTMQGLDIQLVVSGVISGEVMTKNGDPMPDVSLYFNDSSGSQRARTNEKGEYRFSVMPGKVYPPSLYPMQLYIPAESHPGQEFDIMEGQEIDSVDYIYAGISVGGKVVTADGKPVSDAPIYSEIRLHPAASPMMRFAAKSRADGTFTLAEDSSEGTELTLVSEKPSEGLRGVTTITVAPDISVKITVSGGISSSISGRVVDAAGVPVPDVFVLKFKRNEKGSYNTVKGKQTRTDAEGEFRAEGLMAGSFYSVELHKDGYRSAVRDFEMTAGEMDLGEIILEIDESEVGSIKGIVVDIYGKPIVGAGISTETGLTVYTDANGGFQMVGLRDDPSYELELWIHGLSGTGARQNVCDMPLNLPRIRFVLGKYDHDGEMDIGQKKEFYHLIGQEAPPLQVGEWLQGKGTSLGELRGKTVFLYFWAGWCEPSVRILRELNEVHQLHRNEVAIIGIHQATQDVEQLAEQIRSAGVLFSICVDDEDRFSRPRTFQSLTFSNYYICGIPTILHIDQNGEFVGEVDIACARQIAEKSKMK